ncbi:MAG: hypothetical protein B7Z80_24425 [Rhodospirillales bacterium 20-64-7]|nr:MAG: hypothetical protein B7Z80_24425 [Rhodospirillales bacterium 20-64-7]
MRMSDHGTAIWHIAHTATRARRQDLLAALVAQSGWAVQAGPFAGMIVSDRVAWGDGDLLPKLLGCYESELHPTLAEVTKAAPDLVINIGAGEGYYAIGLARLLPHAFVHAFDTAAEAQDICRSVASLNQVNQRVSVAGACSPDLLNALLPRGRMPLVISDCEGHERDLINPARVPSLRTATLIIECHDFVDASITNTLAERLNPTHDLVAITESGRNPNESTFLRGLNSLDRWLAVCEYRPTMMHWLVARPRI